MGEWFFPDGTIVPRQGAAPTADFTRSGFTQQVRLNHRNNAMTPTGVFECRVPARDYGGGGELTSEVVTASITLSTGQYTPSYTHGRLDTVLKQARLWLWYESGYGVYNTACMR